MIYTMFTCELGSGFDKTFSCLLIPGFNTVGSKLFTSENKKSCFYVKILEFFKFSYFFVISYRRNMISPFKEEFIVCKHNKSLILFFSIYILFQSILYILIIPHPSSSLLILPHPYPSSSSSFLIPRYATSFCKTLKPRLIMF